MPPKDWLRVTQPLQARRFSHLRVLRRLCRTSIHQSQRQSQGYWHGHVSPTAIIPAVRTRLGDARHDSSSPASAPIPAPSSPTVASSTVKASSPEQNPKNRIRQPESTTKWEAALQAIYGPGFQAHLSEADLELLGKIEACRAVLVAGRKAELGDEGYETLIRIYQEDVANARHDIRTGQRERYLKSVRKLEARLAEFVDDADVRSSVMAFFYLMLFVQKVETGRMLAALQVQDEFAKKRYPDKTELYMLRQELVKARKGFIEALREKVEGLEAEGEKGKNKESVEATVREMRQGYLAERGLAMSEEEIDDFVERMKQEQSVWLDRGDGI